MERALRKNIMYHSQYNPKLDTTTNRLVCKYLHKCGEEPLQLSKKKALFDRRYFQKPPGKEEKERKQKERRAQIEKQLRRIHYSEKREALEKELE